MTNKYIEDVIQKCRTQQAQSHTHTPKRITQHQRKKHFTAQRKALRSVNDKILYGILLGMFPKRSIGVS